MSIIYRVQQNGTDVFSDTREEYADLASVVPAALLDNMQVTTVTTVFVNDDIVSVVEPVG